MNRLTQRLVPSQLAWRSWRKRSKSYENEYIFPFAPLNMSLRRKSFKSSFSKARKLKGEMTFSPKQTCWRPKGQRLKCTTCVPESRDQNKSKEKYCPFFPSSGKEAEKRWYKPNKTHQTHLLSWKVTIHFLWMWSRRRQPCHIVRHSAKETAIWRSKILEFHMTESLQRLGFRLALSYQRLQLFFMCLTLLQSRKAYLWIPSS